MIGTLIGAAAAILAYIFEIQEVAIPGQGDALAWLSTLVVLLPFLLHSLSYTAIQKAIRHTTPRLGNMWQKDLPLKWWHLLVFVTGFASFLISLYLAVDHPIEEDLGLYLPVWLLLIGISMDGLYHLQQQLGRYLDPFYVLSKLLKKGQIEIQTERELELYDSFDALTEMCLKANVNHDLSITSSSIDILQRLGCLFLDTSKSLTHHEMDDDSKKLGITDKVSYTVFVLMTRFEIIHDEAIARKLEPVCSQLISAVSKVIFSAAKCDMSLTPFPLHCLGRMAIKAQRAGLTEVGSKAICNLVPLTKSILTEADVTYAELKEPMLTMISQLQEISREMFRQDKTIDPRILTQPFKDLKVLFSSEKLAQHQDTPVIMAQIERAQGEFEALDAVLKAMPTIPST